MKKMTRRTFLAFSVLLASIPSDNFAQELPKTDRRLAEIRHLDLTYDFAGYRSREEWLGRAAQLKKQVLASAGLWPAPPKLPIKATIFGKVDRNDHTVEKVYFESYPGFYVTGNLYRPKTVTGKIPAVLCPHGHWAYGRLESQQLNSGPARAASFARQGYVAFSYDMVGYNDSAAISHRFAPGHRENVVDRETLWSVNLLGLQLWNSIRSVDFLLTLPEVDPERIACTGESGGGTQTFLLMAVDDRIKLSAPVNMVSFLMQGGSLCENSPNLRIDTNNVEIASVMAPRPMMLVSATGDWTKNTMSSEYPAVRNIYRLFNAEDKVMAVQMDAPHNYNQPSREAVYGWFAHWLTGRTENGPIKERSGGVAAIPDLLVFFGRQRPDNELNEARLTESLIEAGKKQLDEMQPRNAASLERFREQFGDTFRYSLMAEFPDPGNIISGEAQTSMLGGVIKKDLVISRRDKSDRVSVTLYRSSSKQATNSLVALVTAEPGEGTTGGVSPDTDNLIALLNKAGHSVLLVRGFPGGRRIPDKIRFFTTYNRTDEANRVQDVLTAIAYLKSQNPGARLSVIATGQAGLWALLARAIAPSIDRMVVDVTEFDSTSDEAFVKYMPIPGIRRAGDFATAATIAPLTPLLLHNTGNKFRAERIESVYKAFGKAEDFKAQPAKLSNSELAAYVSVARP